MAPGLPSNFIAELPVADTFSYFLAIILTQTLFFGIFSFLMVLTTRQLVKRGIRTPSCLTLLLGTTAIYLLAAIYWIYHLVDLNDRVTALTRPRAGSQLDAPNLRLVAKSGALVDSIILTNYIFVDAFLIWRAWILCAAQKTRKFIWVAIVAWWFAAVAVMMTIGFRALYFPNSQMAEVAEVMALALSMVSNFCATGSVGWDIYQQVDGRELRVEDAMACLAALIKDGGILFTLSSTTVFISRFIPLPIGVLSSVYLPINVQISCAYPAAMIYLMCTSNQQFTAPLAPLPDRLTSPDLPKHIQLPSASARQRSGLPFISNPILTQPRKSIPAAVPYRPHDAVASASANGKRYIPVPKKAKTASRFSDDS